MTSSSLRLVTGSLVMLASFSLQAHAVELNLDDEGSIRATAATVAHGLQSLYTGNQPGGVVGKFPYKPYYWWESGAAWGAMINYWHYTGDDTYNEVTLQALESQLSPTNDFMPQSERFDLGNDDQSFWALAAMSAAEYGFPEPSSPYPTWLQICENVFHDYVSRWSADSDSCGGGLKWQIYPENPGYDYKNSISNGGFFQLAARLARVTGNQTYADWADTVWKWTTHVGLIDGSYNVYDGTDDTEGCTSLDHDQWSYNVGMWLYGAAVMQNHTDGEQTWVARTNGLLGASKTFLSPFSNATDVLYEFQCEPKGNCNTDQLSMKGYLARWLAGTSVMMPATAGRVHSILRASATGAAKACSGGTDGSTCGSKWYVGEWDGTTGMGQQLVALEVISGLLANSASPPDAARTALSSAASSSTSISSMTATVTNATTSACATSSSLAVSAASQNTTVSSTTFAAIVTSNSTTPASTVSSTPLSVPTSILTDPTPAMVTLETSSIVAATFTAAPESPTPSPYTGSAPKVTSPVKLGSTALTVVVLLAML